jgi:hypothetical protein
MRMRIEFHRGYDPAARERIIVPLPQQMDDNELDQSLANYAEWQHVESLEEEEESRFWVGVGFAFGITAAVGLLGWAVWHVWSTA